MVKKVIFADLDGSDDGIKQRNVKITNSICYESL